MTGLCYIVSATHLDDPEYNAVIKVFASYDKATTFVDEHDDGRVRYMVTETEFDGEE